MTTTNAATIRDLVQRDLHDRAFHLADPGPEGAEAQRTRHVTARTWRDEIATTITDAELVAAEVTIEQVCAAVAYFTATEARTVRGNIHRAAGAPGWLILAAGYRKGPAGP